MARFWLPVPVVVAFLLAGPVAFPADPTRPASERFRGAGDEVPDFQRHVVPLSRLGEGSVIPACGGNQGRP
jgi:hypothetical protein